jgi:hypothetical protein
MKQLELDLQIKGKSSFDDIPTLKELIDRKKERPKHLENLSDKHYQLMQEIFKRRF